MQRINRIVITIFIICLVSITSTAFAVPPKEKNYDMTSLFVKFKLSALDQANTIVSNLGATEVSRVFNDKTDNPGLLNGWRKLTLGEGVDPIVIQKALSKNPNVEATSLNYYVELADHGRPNDPLYDQQWALNNDGQTGGTPGADIDAETVWHDISSAGDIVVAVLDSGIDFGHEDLAANMWVNPGEIPLNGLDDDGNGCFDDVYGCNFINAPQFGTGLYYGMGNSRQYDLPQFRDDMGHGTHVAGIVGAVGNNGVGVSGIAQSIKLMAVRTHKRQGCGESCIRASVDTIVRGIEYAVDHGAKIINASWGLKKVLVDQDGSTSIFSDAITYTQNNDVLFVAAAHNASLTGSPTDLDDPGQLEDHWYPQKFTHDNLIVVANTDHNDELFSESNYGVISVDLGAPGTDIVSTVPVREPLSSNDDANMSGYNTLTGTSMSSPLVAGAAALVWAKNPTWTALQVKQKILDTVKLLPSLSGKTVTGGRLDLVSALDLNQPPFVDLAVTSASATANIAVGGQITMEADVTNLGNMTSSPYIRTYFYLSEDEVFSTTDHNIGISSNMRFEPGQTRHITLTGTIGSTWAPGTYHLFVYTDGRNNQDEIDDATGNENNLIQGNDVNVTTQVDLAMTGGNAPAGATQGTQVTVDGTVTNIGAGSTYWAIRVYWYLSVDDQYDSNDWMVGYSYAFALSEGQSRTVAGSLNIHSNRPAGTYRLLGVVDPYDKIPEVDSPNNQNGNNLLDYGNFVVTAP